MSVDSAVVIDKQIEAAGSVLYRLSCRGVAMFVGTWTSRRSGICPIKEGAVKLVCAEGTRGR